MAIERWAATGTRVVLFTLSADLTNGSRKAADYDNDDAAKRWKKVILALEGIQYLTTAPTARVNVADLWILPGDNQGTEVFPGGGDGTVGTNRDPQGAFFVGAFECLNPSTTADDDPLFLVADIYPASNRFVLKNTSGQTWDADPDNVTLAITPYSTEIA